MSFSQLFKIPLILAAMVGFHKSTTPPHPPPGSQEEERSTSLEIILRNRSGALIVEFICWCAALGEIAVILAAHAASSSHSQQILSLLVFPGSSTQSIAITKLFICGVTMTTLGAFIRSSCYNALGSLFTFEMSIRVNHKLVVDGPYSWVRHPGYVGVILTVSGMITWIATPGSWARECGVFQTTVGQLFAFTYVGLSSIIIAGLLARMSIEDAALKREFGREWEEWSARVPYKLVPCLY